MNRPILHGYWRSSASYRVRIALALKGVVFDQITHDLRRGEQHAPEYLALAPHGLVPALEKDGTVLIESPAILEWIEARWPAPALLPAAPDDAAKVRAIAALVGCDIHPLVNLRVMAYLRRGFGASDADIGVWQRHWIATGFEALDPILAAYGGTYAFGDSPTLADCYLVPQVYNAQRFGLDMTAFPRIQAVVAAAAALPAFLAAHPDRQVDADKP